MKESNGVQDTDLKEAKHLILASKMLEGLNSKENTQQNDSKDAIFAESELIQDGSKDISAILPERLLHIQPIIEEEDRIDNLQEENNDRVDDNRAELDENIGKISTKAFLNQRPELAALGE
jgi:hypothetical protein